MSKLFIDTSGWLSLFVSTETHHRAALKHFDEAIDSNYELFTTNYVITELVPLLSIRQKMSRTELFKLINIVRDAPYLDTIHIDEITDNIAWALCESRPDKAWSLVDASSFVVMGQLNIRTALTTDKHFEQAGFIRLLK